MATIPQLYNFNEARTSVYVQEFTFTEDDNGQKYLDHIPKDQSLVIKDVTLDTYLTVVDNKDPASGEVYYDYRSDFDYVSAKGLLVFNEEDAQSGDLFQVSYIPVASRVDAGVINKLIEHYNTYEDNIWTKTDLLTPTQANIIDWTAIKGRPGYATNSTGGLISASDIQLLHSLAGLTTTTTASASGGVIAPKLTTAVYNPTVASTSTSAASTALGFEVGAGLSLSSDNTLSLEVDSARGVLGLTQNYIAALEGATGSGKSPNGPGASNKYVLDGDIRLTDNRNPIAHTHSIEDVNNLQQVLDGKAASIHTHSADDITGIETLKGEDGTPASVTISSTVTLEAGSQAKVTNVGPDEHNVKLKFEIPKGADGKMVLNWQDWEQLTDSQKAQIRVTGPKGESGYSGAVVLGTVEEVSSATEASVVIHEPELTRIGDTTYNASKIDFKIPQGPKGEQGEKGESALNTLAFTADSENWSNADEDGNFTYTAEITGAIPLSLAYEEISTGLYELTFATVRFDTNHIYIISGHKFTGKVYYNGGVE